MAFNSYIFILGFLPVFLIAYHYLPGLLYKRSRGVISLNSAREYCIIAGSVCFLAAAGWRLLLLLAVSCAVNWLAAVFIRRNNTQAERAHRTGTCKAIFVCGMIVDIALLAVFKYFHFFIEDVLGRNWEALSLPELFMPLGISFVTFQQIAWLSDVYHGKISEWKASDYLFYITYFPKYTQGPISGYEELVGQIRNPEWCVETPEEREARRSAGLWMFAEGLGRKVLLADVIGKGVDWGYQNIASLTWTEAVFVMVGYTLQIYLDFGGYSRMALGISCMLGIDLPDNFDQPYHAVSVNDFWKRWHISLTSFLRNYLYIPLGGNRRGTLRTYLNIMIVFALSGIWHGAGWTFLIWGLMHGAASCLDRVWRKGWKKIPVLVRWAVTFLFVNIAWVFFRAPAAKDAVQVLGRILSHPAWTATEDGGAVVIVHSELLETLRAPAFTAFANAIPSFEGFLERAPWLPAMAIFALTVFVSFTVHDRGRKSFRMTVGKAVLTGMILFMSVVSFASVTTFIYGTF